LDMTEDMKCALVKYDRNVNRLWIARYNAAPNAFDGPYAFTVDAAGNACVAAVSDEPWRFATLKYDGSGNRVWTANFTPHGVFDFPVGIATASVGDIYVAGQSRYFEGPGG